MGVYAIETEREAGPCLTYRCGKTSMPPKKSQDTIPLAVFTESIILGKYRTEIEAIRNAESKEKRNELKKKTARRHRVGSV